MGLSSGVSLLVKIYSVGVWNARAEKEKQEAIELKFTPLEFETMDTLRLAGFKAELKFTPLECETSLIRIEQFVCMLVKIYSVGVWNKMQENKE